MPIQPLRGQKLSQQSSTQDQSLINKLGTGLSQLGTAALGAPTKAITSIGEARNYLGRQFPNVFQPEEPIAYEKIPTTTENIRKSLGVSNPESGPARFGEDVINRFATDLPIIIATGGLSIPASLGRGAVAATGAQAAKDLGLGPWGELLGSFGGQWAGEKGLNALKSAYNTTQGISNFKSPSGIRPYLENIEKEAYKKSEDLYKKVKVPSGKLEESLNHIEKQLRRGDPSAAKMAVEKSLENLQGKIAKGQVPIQDVIDFKKSFYNSSRTRGAEEAPWYKLLTKNLDSFIKEEGKVVPEGLKLLNQGNSLHGALKSGEYMKEVISDVLNPQKFAKSKILKSLFGAAGLAINKVPGIEAAKFFATRPEARKYYKDAVLYAAKEDKARTANALKNLVKLTDAYEGTEPEKGPQIRLLRGSKIR